MGRYDDRTVLPAAVREALDVGDDQAVIAGLGELPLGLFYRAAHELVWQVSGRARPRPASLWARFRAMMSGRKGLRRSPYPDLFHHSGYVREAALRRIVGPVPNAFFVVALVYRLNDWVPEVRIAAAEALRRASPPVTDPAIFVQALLFLLPRVRDWSRWGDELAPFDALLDRPEVAALLAASLRDSATGPSARLLRQALRRPVIDAHLPDLLRKARQPAVRALALRVLAAGEVGWEMGPPTIKQWIDKSLGRFRFVRRTETRAVASPFTRAELTGIGAADKSAAVRLAAATALSLNFAEIAEGRALAERLAADRNRVVRERAAFLLR
jgi:hypothetical protein